MHHSGQVPWQRIQVLTVEGSGEGLSMENCESSGKHVAKSKKRIFEDVPIVGVGPDSQF